MFPKNNSIRPGKLFAFTVLITAVSFSACKKDSTTAATTTVTEADAADAVTEAVTPASAGMVTQSATAVVIVNDNSLACGTATDSTISGQNISGAAVTYNYLLAWNSLMTCTDNIPSSYTFNFTGKSNYDAPRISSADSTQASFSITGIEPGTTQYVFNASYIRNGSEVSKVREQRSFSSKITITSSNLTLDKTTGAILSGTATATISGAASGGANFSFSGTITFLGNQAATLVFASGTPYDISW